MRKIIVLFALIICLTTIVSCQERNNESQGTEQTIQNDSNVVTLTSFFGEPLAFNDSVYSQIEAIASRNDFLSYQDSILQIADVRWGINVGERSIILLSSVSPESPKVKTVIDYLNKLYGEPYDPITDEEWPDCKWLVPYDTINNTTGHFVRIRPGRGEAGGLCIIFN